MARTIEIEPLVEAIRQLQDDEMILSFYEQLGIVVSGAVHHPSRQEKLDIAMGLQDIKERKVSSHADVMAEVEKWALE